MNSKFKSNINKVETADDFPTPRTIIDAYIGIRKVGSKKYNALYITATDIVGFATKITRKELIQICNEPFGIDYRPFGCVCTDEGDADTDGRYQEWCIVYDRWRPNIEVRKKYRDIINKIINNKEPLIKRDKI